jgi:hypothetical protein
VIKNTDSKTTDDMFPLQQRCSKKIIFSIMESAGNDENFSFKVSIDETMLQIDSPGSKPL